MRRFLPSLIGLLVGITAGAMVIALVMTRNNAPAQVSVAPIRIDSSAAPSKAPQQKRVRKDRSAADEVEAPAPAKIENDDVDEPDDTFGDDSDDDEPNDEHSGPGGDDSDDDKDDHDNSGPGDDNSGPGGGDDDKDDDRDDD